MERAGAGGDVGRSREEREQWWIRVLGEHKVYV